MTAGDTMARVPFNDLGRAYQAIREELLAATTRVMDSGWYVQGPEHAAFEAEFGEFLGGVTSVGVANGTDALELALRAIDPPSGAAIVTVANAGMYATTAIRRAGLRPSYADVDQASLLMTSETLGPVLNGDVAVVIVTHLYGRMADVAGIRSLCEPRGIAILEDCAQAVGASRSGQRAGSLGDVAAVSLYPTKNLGALGDGGAVVTGSPEVAARVRELRQYGWTSKYHVGRDGGRNSRLDEIQAAILRVRLPLVDAGNRARRAVIARYAEAARGTSVRVLPAEGEAHAGHLAVALSDHRDDVRRRLSEAGVQTDMHYPVPDHQQVTELHTGQVSLPVTEAAARQVFSLPCFPELTNDEVERVCRVLAGT